MADGSDAIADWPLLNALVNTASGATWVSIHHGGGVGIGRSIHAGQVSVADGTALAGAEAGAGADQRPGDGRHPARRRRLRPGRRGRGRGGAPAGADGRAGTSTRARRDDDGCRVAAVACTRPSGAGDLLRAATTEAASTDVGGDRRHRRATGGSPGRRTTPACASGSPARRPRAGWTSSRTAPATSGRGGATRIADRPRRRPRLAPRLGARRRRLRRPARRGVGARRGRRAARPRVRARPARSASPCFADEEGARFGVACAGSRLLTGALDPDRARALSDADGLDAWPRRCAGPGRDPAALGRDDETLRRVGAFVELHVEQGRGLVDRLDRPVGVGTAIWPHGRWRLDLPGEANHAGTTRAGRPPRPDARPRRRPCSPPAAAAAWHDALATCGKVAVGAERGQRRPVASPPGSTPAAPATRRAGGRRRGGGGSSRRTAAPSSRSRGPPDGVRRDPGGPPRRGLGARGSAASACWRPAPGTTPASSPPPASPTAMLFVRNPTGRLALAGGARRAEPTACRGRGAGARSLAGRWRVRATVRLAARRARDAVLGRARAAARRAARRRRSPSTGSRRARRFAAVTPGTAPGDAARLPGRRPARASPTRTPTPSTGRCAGARTTAAAPSGPGASGCTPSPPGSTPTPTSRSPGPSYAEMALAGHHRRRRVPLPAPRPGRQPLRRPERDGRGAAPAAADAGVRLTLLDTCYLPAASDGHAARGRAAPVRRRHRRALGGPGRRAAATARGCGSARPSTRSAPCRATQLRRRRRGRGRGDGPLHVHVSEQPAENDACRAPTALTPTELLAAAGRCSGRATTAVHATHLTADDIALLGGSGTTRLRLPDHRARPRRRHRPGPARCATPGRRSRSAPTSTP